MEVHTGFSGVAFAAIWTALFVPKLWAATGATLLFWLGSIAALFLILAFAAFNAMNYVISALADAKTDGNEVEVRNHLSSQVRRWIAGLSAAYVIVCCVLIWLTGGAASAFTSFYVMIFTLTISKNRIKPPGIGFWILGYFLASILLSTLLAAFGTALIPKQHLLTILDSTPHVIINILFICFSLIVPTISGLLVELRQARLARVGT